MNSIIFVWITVIALTFTLTLTNLGLTQMAYSTSFGDSIREEVKEKVESSSTDVGADPGGSSADMLEIELQQNMLSRIAELGSQVTISDKDATCLLDRQKCDFR
jgi:hypothetical protein